jgi:hypothetical protein
MGTKMGSTTVLPPKCAACLLRKQEQTSKEGDTLVKNPGGILKMDKLEPGNLVFSDQYESPLLGRQFSACGNDLTTQKFRGGTIFCDAASSKLTVVHQVGLTGTETVQGKICFKREAFFWQQESKSEHTAPIMEFTPRKSLRMSSPLKAKVSSIAEWEGIITMELQRMPSRTPFELLVP